MGSVVNRKFFRFGGRMPQPPISQLIYYLAYLKTIKRDQSIYEVIFMEDLANPWQDQLQASYYYLLAQLDALLDVVQGIKKKPTPNTPKRST